MGRLADQAPGDRALLVGGFALGPLTGWLDPAADFCAAYRPVVSIAVAIILFEGGLTLNVAEIRETSRAVRRLILFGGPLIWGMTALTAHFVAGLSWPTASLLGAILVVTGPTVVIPLLRQAHLATRPASLLRWEAIVNDAIGTLFAVMGIRLANSRIASLTEMRRFRETVTILLVSSLFGAALIATLANFLSAAIASLLL